MKAVEELAEVGISVEVIDAQSLLPFDLNHQVVESLKKTNRLIVVDEDVPGGCSAYLMQQIIENQGGYSFLDAAPVTLSAKAHRPAYSSDGDYFSKPNAEDVFEAIYSIMHEADPSEFPPL
jgi:pyruvate/2-oxoglutarate/acetoin dehydrogenase E1 component